MHKSAALPALAALLCGLAAPAAHALFKVVGPDGKVTYTDRAPQPADGKMQPVTREASRAPEATLPFTLRQVAARFPVTLYTASDCGEACNMARAFLQRRGVPFAERTATTVEDREAWKRIVGGEQAPTLAIGGQSLRGFTPVAWDETLDVAGYPRNSLLPANWQPPAPVPLVPPKAAAAAPAAPPLPVPAPVDNPGTPAGIRF